MKQIDNVYPKCPSLCNCLNIRRASHAVTQFYDEVLTSSGLSIVQLGLLWQLEVAEQVTTISELAKIMRIDRTTLNRNMKPLTDNGLIAVKPGIDSRKREVMLTQAGKAAVLRGRARWNEAQESIRTYIGEEDLVKLTQLLSKLEAIVP